VYKCEVCKTVSRPGQARLTHVIYRPAGVVRYGDDGPRGRLGTEVAREVALCPKCFGMVAAGVPYPELVSREGRPEPVKVGKMREIKPPPPPPPMINEPVTGGGEPVGEEMPTDHEIVVPGKKNGRPPKPRGRARGEPKKPRPRPKK
jgi:hypothetical protein